MSCRTYQNFMLFMVHFLQIKCSVCNGEKPSRWIWKVCCIFYAGFCQNLHICFFVVVFTPRMPPLQHIHLGYLLKGFFIWQKLSCCSLNSTMRHKAQTIEVIASLRLGSWKILYLLMPHFLVSMEMYTFILKVLQLEDAHIHIRFRQYQIVFVNFLPKNVKYHKL